MTTKKLVAAVAATVLLTAGAASGEAAGSVAGNIRASKVRVERMQIPGDGVQRDHNAIGFSIGGKKRAAAITANVQLIGRDMDMSRFTNEQLNAWYRDGVAPSGAPVFIAKADANGNYHIDGVPEGAYYLLIVSPNQVDTRNLPLSAAKAEEKLQAYLPDWNAFSLLVIGMNDYVVQEVLVRDGLVATANYDFVFATSKK